MFKTIDFPSEILSYFQINNLELLVVADPYRVGISKLPLEVCLIHSITLESKNEENSECLKYLEASSLFHPSNKLKLEKLGSFMPTYSSKKPSKLDLKRLLSNLRYVFLGQDFTFWLLLMVI